MNNFYKKFLILTSIIIITGLGYLYIYKSDLSEASDDELLSSSLDDGSSSNISDDTKSDASFILSLSSLEKITINSDFFSKESFTSLKDNNVVLESVTPGRDNPFIPFSSTTNTTTSDDKEDNVSATN